MSTHADIVNHADIINLWPSLSAFADDLGFKYGTAKKMRRRQRIAPVHWPSVAEAAAQRGIENVTFELLANTYAAAAATEAAE